MTNHEKRTETALRRALNKAGYSLHKSRKRFSPDNLGGYAIVDVYYNAIVAGSRFELDLDAVAEWLEWVNS